MDCTVDGSVLAGFRKVLAYTVWCGVAVLAGISLVSCETSPEIIRPVKHHIMEINADVVQSDNIIVYTHHQFAYDTLRLENGALRDSLEWQEGYYLLELNDHRIPLFVRKGDDLKMNLKQGNITFSGQGANENEYLQQKERLRAELPHHTKDYTMYAALNEADFVLQTDSVYKLYDNLLQRNRDRLDPDFVYLEEQTNKQFKAIRLAEYPAQKRLVLQNQSYRVSKNYPNPYAEVLLEEPKLAVTPNYMRLLQNSMNDLVSEIIEEDSTKDYYVVYQQELAKAYIPAELKDELGCENAKDGIIYTTDPEGYRDAFLLYATSERCIHNFEKMYAARKQASDTLLQPASADLR